MSSALVAARMTMKYTVFLPKGARIMNYKVGASGRTCDICGHVPVALSEENEGYSGRSMEPMRLMRVRLPEGVLAKDVDIGKKDFTVTGKIIEISVCNDTTNCKKRAALITNEDGSRKYPDDILGRFDADAKTE